MSVKLHIERLVVDPVALPAADVPRFQNELRGALQRLIAPPPAGPVRRRDAVERLADRSAQAIFRALPR